MNAELLCADVRQRLSGKRWRHTRGVMNSAAFLAEKHGVDITKAQLAALLHDVAREWTEQEWLVQAQAAGLAVDEAARHAPVLLHAPLGAWVARERYQVQDEEVLAAVARHTLGGPGLSDLDKVIYLADCLEEGRIYAGVEALRRLAAVDLDAAMIGAYDQTLRFMLDRRETIHPQTVLGRNELLWRLGR